MTTLLIRLDGPMQSWGTQSRFRVRETGMEPSKSGVIGLLCAALGKPREERPDDRPRLADLARLRMGVRVDRQGVVKRDYHTAGGTHRKGDFYGVIRAHGKGVETVISERYYLADAAFLVGLEGEDEALLRRLHEALADPVWPLSLGRKAFVPGEPVYLADGLTDLPLEEALRTYPWLARSDAEREAMRERAAKAEAAGDPIRLRLVLDAPPGSTADLRRDVPLSVRCDVPLSFAERRFTIRHVQSDSVALTDAHFRRV